MSDAPKRWLEDGSEATDRVRDLLAKAKPTPPMPVDVRIASAASVGELGSAKAVAGGLATKLVLMGFAAAALAAGWAWGFGQTTASVAPRPEEAATVRQAVPSSSGARIEPTGTEALEVAVAQAPEEANAEHVGDTLEPSPLIETPEPVRAPSKRRARLRSSASEPASTETVAAAALETERETPPDSESVEQGSGANDEEVQELPGQQPDTLAAEVGLIERARRQLARDPGAALTSAREHMRRFPRGQFAAAAELIEINALLGLGRRADAESRARAMATRRPSTIFRDRLVSLVGEAALQ